MAAKADVHKFFKAYEKIYNEAIAGNADMDDVGKMYSAGFVSGRRQRSWSARMASS
ncbi:hypothetical protein [Mesorhizobium huakuii]|uniref:Uncharacterized protein n=1 Tax=Mesorhizobium huakuii TaxID=28104 RepID=A0ABZ0VT27_9HYPH|nr:hypothetical protein [Mesorhizobium huakuii]WQB99434.1 hypothetical protein U0R22_003613 [Mesorhizobium huakuii]